MTKHRITIVNNHDARTTVRTFTGPNAETKARNEWGSVSHSRFVRYAIWTEIVGERGWNENIKEIHGEIHGRFYIGGER
jgi:hypothetical protein